MGCLGKKPWQDESKLRKLYHEEQLTHEEIAEKLGCSRSCISQWCAEFGIEPIRKEVHSDLDDQSILERLYIQKEWSTYEIAEKYGCCEHTVRQRLMEFGIERRDKSDYASELLANKSELEKLYKEEGLDSREISELVDTTPSNVLYWLDKHNISRRRSGPDVSDKLSDSAGEIEKLYWQDGYSLNDLAEKYGCHNTTVLTHMERQDIERRNTSEALDLLTSHDESLYYGPNWDSVRKREIERANEKCEICGMARGEHYQKFSIDLHVHHIQKFRTFDSYKAANKPKNLAVLCVHCHRKWEGIPLQPQ